MIDAVVDRCDELDRFLAERGVDCRRFWHPLHTQKPYRQPDDRFPNCTRIAGRAIWLPSAYTLTDEDILLVCQYIREFFANA